MKSVKYLLAFAVLIALFAVINNQETSSFIEKKGTYSNENALKKLLDVTHKEDEEPVDDEDEDEDDLDYEEEDDDEDEDEDLEDEDEDEEDRKSVV